MPLRFQRLCVALAGAAAGVLSLTTPAAAVPSPAPGPVPGVLGDGYCSSGLNLPGMASVGGTSLRLAARTTVWNTHPGTCTVTYSFTRSFTPSVSGYYTLTNGFSGTLYMGQGAFTGSFVARLDSRVSGVAGAALVTETAQNVSSNMVSADFGGGEISAQFGLHAGHAYSWVSTFSVSTTTLYPYDMDVAVKFEGPTHDNSDYHARSTLDLRLAADIPDPNVSPVPEPGTGVMLAAGVLALAVARRRRS